MEPLHSKKLERSNFALVALESNTPLLVAKTMVAAALRDKVESQPGATYIMAVLETEDLFCYAMAFATMLLAAPVYGPGT
jgi:hypothetical protein